MSCLTTSKLLILCNGNKSEGFVPKRGLRQGDHLSPYLFVLCMEVLGHKIQGAVEKGKWQPCRASQRGPNISHLFFADDLLFM